MTVKKDECALFYHIFLFLVPVGLIQNNIIKICWYGMLACSMAVILLNVIAQKRHIMKGVLPYMLFYLLFQTIATYKSNGNWKYGVCTLIVVCTFIIFIQVQVELDFGRLLTVLDIAIEVQILMELILYIFGIDFLQSLACSYLYYCVWGTLHLVRLQDRGKRDLHIYFISFLYLFAFFIVPEINTDGTVNYEWTFFIVLAFMCSLYFFRKLTYKMWKTLNINTIYLYILGFNIMFVIVQNFTKIPGINYILHNVMGKDITLTGRTSIWAMAKGLIMRNPVWGYGAGFAPLVKNTDYWTNWMGVHGPHNQFLAVCLAGGFVTLTVYLIMIYMSTHSLQKYKRNPKSIIICMGLFVSYIELSLTYRNILNCIPLFALFVISNNMANLVNKENR